ncbi:MAG: hypothetical protein NTZ49_05225 [Candidatus Parcubacteria bacterium]|nr:hypothetical protein [Candidatus Parcubacteria bacterium]
MEDSSDYTEAKKEDKKGRRKKKKPDNRKKELRKNWKTRCAARRI